MYLHDKLDSLASKLMGSVFDDRSSIPGRGRDFSLRHRIHAVSGTRTVFYLMGSVATFPFVKAAEA
jgi:hypothetical protein